MEYRLRVEREPSDYTKRNYPNLAKTPNHVTVMQFSTKKPLDNMDDRQVRHIIEKVMEQKPRLVREDVDLQREEQGSLVRDREGGGEIWSGPFTVPPEHVAPDTDNPSTRASA